MASCLYPYRRPLRVGFVPAGQASAASPAFAVAVAVAAPAVVPLVAAVVATVALEPLAAAVPVVNALADPAHVSSVVVDAAAELHVVVAVAAELVLRRVRPVAVVVAQVALCVRLAVHLQHVLLVAVRSAVVVAPAPCAVVRVVYPLTHAAVEPVELAVEEQLVVARFAVRRVPVAHLSP